MESCDKLEETRKGADQIFQCPDIAEKVEFKIEALED